MDFVGGVVFTVNLTAVAEKTTLTMSDKSMFWLDFCF